ncbi:polysaccharide export protein [Sphingomonas sabuli]|uniref:Polysaccharide export protein n=1 Tax=Sphingomonas sabuli TaxID=2764186 RepID=A0A7G9L3J2_9SPHN|nr:polysaccharide biosynthesis/export family protein [Sphingomonas sabuli]QNM83191.1 polysaccharide export protein [Sphingomonas sabuli]
MHRLASSTVRLVCAIGALTAVAGCADKRGGPIAYNAANFGSPDTTVSAALEGGYRIAPMDKLAIRVFGMDDLTGDYQVDLRGNISLPLIGEVPAMDKTPAELDTVLTDRFGEKYLQNPDVSVGIKEATGHNITVDGSVEKPGTYPVVGPMTLMQAVALAQGTDEFANLRRVAVFRTIDGTRKAAAFDLVSIRRGEMPDPQVYSGDIVIVDGSSIKQAQKKLIQAFPLLSIFRPF